MIEISDVNNKNDKELSKLNGNITDKELELEGLKKDIKRQRELEGGLENVRTELVDKKKSKEILEQFNGSKS